jgi:hypothetical protein
MARPTVQTVTLRALDADAICLSQTPAAGGSQNLTIAGALASGGVATISGTNIAQQLVSITTTIDDSARTFVVTGTDAWGNVISESLAGPATTTNTTRDFATVTTVNVDDDTAGAITVGIPGAGHSKWIPLNYHMNDFNVGLFVALSSGATQTFEVQYTPDVVLTSLDPNGLSAFADATLTAKTVTSFGNSVIPARAVRLSVTGFTDGTATFTIIESGIKG